jgi:hypothetical protein
VATVPAHPAGERPTASREPFELAGIRWWPGRAAEPTVLRSLLEAALAAVASGARNQKTGRRKALYLLALGPGPEPSHLLKVNEYPRGAGLRRRLLGSKARRELRLAEEIAARGIPTPLPLAAGERREGLRVASCFLLVPFLRGAEDLRRVAGRPAERRLLGPAFGRFARRVHAAGVEQDDFQPNNFLRGPGGAEDLWLIDCERVRLRAALPASECARELAKLERELPAASLAERARFLRAYAGGGRGAWHALWREIEAEMRRLAGRDAARLRRAAGRAGRRFARIESAGWRGVRAATADASALAADLPALSDPGAAGAEPSLAGARAHYALRFAGSAREAEAAFATAVLLARRGLGPPPAAQLQRGTRALLVFAGALPTRLAELPPEARRARRAALSLLLERLAQLGRLGAVRADLFGLAPPGAPLPVQLLAAPLFDPGAASPGARAARRALAASLLSA